MKHKWHVEVVWQTNKLTLETQKLMAEMQSGLAVVEAICGVEPWAGGACSMGQGDAELAFNTKAEAQQALDTLVKAGYEDNGLWPVDEQGRWCYEDEDGSIKLED